MRFIRWQAGLWKCEELRKWLQEPKTVVAPVRL
jgi:hypothetical protein